MKILLTGSVPQSVWTIAARLNRGGHSVGILSQIDKPVHAPSGIKTHKTDPSHPDALRIMEAARYEAVVFFFASNCEAAGEYGAIQGAMLDAVQGMARVSARCKAEKFVLVTDRRVFGASQQGHEDELPAPDTQAGAIIKAAEDCALYSAGETGLRTLIVRTTSLYDEHDKESFFAAANRCAYDDAPLVLPGDIDTPCDFLHADDMGAFLDFALSMDIAGIIHACYGKARTYGEIAEALLRRHEDLQVAYSGEASRAGALQSTANLRMDWVARHDCLRELDALCPKYPVIEKRKSEKFKGLRRALSVLLPWIELIAMGAVAALLSNAARQNAVLAVVDYMLMFVAIIGIIHGRRLGEGAAAVAVAYYGASWYFSGGDLSTLLYNTDHWLPIGCYILVGELFGYIHDRHRMQSAIAQRDSREMDDQNQFLQTMYRQAYEDRNRLQEQVMRFRDSYGRIYQITRELETLQPQQVFLSTLNVLEDVMQNQSVAIYECKADTPFARLVVYSRGVTGLTNSIDLVKFGEMMDILKDGRVFANTALLPNYPAYAAPVINEGSIKAILMLWDVPFERQSQYYENLFSVVSGLVQSAMVRTLRYYALAGDVYIENTRIMTDEAFRSALDVYRDIRKSHAGQYLLTRIEAASELDAAGYDAHISRAARSTDLVGRMDGAYYVLFPQASAENLPLIQRRFSAQGLACRVVEEDDG